MGGRVADDQFEPQFLKPASAPEPRVWNLGDVVLITMMCLIPLVLFELFFPHHPLLMLAAQGVSFAISLLCARVIISLKTGKGFFASIDWNFPGAERIPQLLLFGLLFSVSIAFLSSKLLPIPKDLPIEKMYETRETAIALNWFGVLVAPFAEELYFRGIVYGALRSALEQERTRQMLGLLLLCSSVGFFTLAWRGIGSGYALFAPVLLAMALLLLPVRDERAALLDSARKTLIAVVLTACAFAFVHSTQLAHAWGPLLSILIVGLVLTAVRVRLNSVAASWLLHTAYNGTLFLISWAGTSGFRKMS
jgi:membrane protease YdiL (CAAX protease family)